MGSIQHDYLTLETTFTESCTLDALIYPMALGFPETNAITAASSASSLLVDVLFPVNTNRDQYAFSCASRCFNTFLLNAS